MAVKRGYRSIPKVLVYNRRAAMNEVLEVVLLERDLEGGFRISSGLSIDNPEETYVQTEWGGILTLSTLLSSIRKMGDKFIKVKAEEDSAVLMI
jgi:hypothetical protein